MGCDVKYGRVCTIFFVGKTRYVERLEERADIPYMDPACFGPSGDEIRLRDRGQGCRGRERLGPNAVDAAEMRNGSELEECVFI